MINVASSVCVQALVDVPALWRAPRCSVFIQSQTQLHVKVGIVRSWTGGRGRARAYGVVAVVRVVVVVVAGRVTQIVGPNRSHSAHNTRIHRVETRVILEARKQRVQIQTQLARRRVVQRPGRRSMKRELAMATQRDERKRQPRRVHCAEGRSGRSARRGAFVDGGRWWARSELSLSKSDPMFGATPPRPGCKNNKRRISGWERKCSSTVPTKFKLGRTRNTKCTLHTVCESERQLKGPLHLLRPVTAVAAAPSPKMAATLHTDIPQL